MHFSKMVFSQDTKTQGLFQIKIAKGTQQLNTRCDLRFPFAIGDIIGTDGKLGMRSADLITVLDQCELPDFDKCPVVR